MPASTIVENMNFCLKLSVEYEKKGLEAIRRPDLQVLDDLLWNDPDVKKYLFLTI